MLRVTDELLKEMTDIIVREVAPRKILFGSHIERYLFPLETR